MNASLGGPAPHTQNSTIITIFDPTVSCTNIHHNLQTPPPSHQPPPQRKIQAKKKLTKARTLITRTFAFPPRFLAPRTMRIRRMLIPDLIEEMDLFFW